MYGNLISLYKLQALSLKSGIIKYKAQAYTNVTFAEVTWLTQMLLYFTLLIALISPPKALLMLGECFYTFSIGLGVQRQNDCGGGL